MCCSASTRSKHPSFKKPSHLFHRSGSWYYRHAVPEKYQKILRRKEIRKSLHCSSEDIANWKAQMLDSLIFLFFNVIEKALNTLGTINWLSLKIDLFEKIDNICKYDVTPFLTADPSTFNEMISHLFSNQLDSTQTYLIPMGRSFKYPFSNDSQFLNPQAEGEEGPVESVVFKTGHGSNMLISETLERYIQEKRRTKVWKFRTERAEIPKIRSILHILSDMPLKMLSIEHLNFYKDACMKLPSNWHKKKPYRNKTIEQILAMNIPEQELKAPKTIAHDLELFRGFLNWCTIRGYIYIPSFNQILTIKIRKREYEYRDILDDDDIRKILRFPQYAEDAAVPPSYFWVILIALYTGARLEEICQLHVDDFCIDEGIPCFDFNSRYDKEVKNLQSNRLVPIHPFLLDDLNILGFVSMMKERGETRIFPELKHHNTTGQFGDRISRMFGRQRRRFGIFPKGKGKKDFHSIRHTVVTNLKHLGVPEPKVSQLVGHKTETTTITYTRYGKPYPTSMIYEVVKKISYNVDFSFLKESHFIVR